MAPTPTSTSSLLHPHPPMTHWHLLCLSPFSFDIYIYIFDLEMWLLIFLPIILKSIHIIHLSCKNKSLIQHMFQLYKTINNYNELRNVWPKHCLNTKLAQQNWPIPDPSESLLKSDIILCYLQQYPYSSVKEARSERSDQQSSMGHY